MGQLLGLRAGGTKAFPSKQYMRDTSAVRQVRDPCRPSNAKLLKERLTARSLKFSLFFAFARRIYVTVGHLFGVGYGTQLLGTTFATFTYNSAKKNQDKNTGGEKKTGKPT